MYKMHFNILDLFSGPRIALGIQNTWIAFLGLGSGYILYTIFTYISIHLAGMPLKQAWSRFGLVPCSPALSSHLPWYSTIIFIFAILLFLIAILLTQTALARSAFMYAKNINYYTWQEAFQFAWKKLLHAVLTPLSIFMLISLVILFFYIMGLLARIPILGPLGLSIFAILWFIAALFILFFLLIAIISIIIGPSILATTESDAFEAVFQSFSVMTSKPFEFILYFFVTIILSIASGFILILVFAGAYSVMSALLTAFSGDVFNIISSKGINTFQTFLAPLLNGVWNKPFTGNLAIFSNTFALFYAIFLLFLFVWSLSYVFSSFCTMTTLNFIILKYKKDNDNLISYQHNEQEPDEYKKYQHENE